MANHKSSEKRIRQTQVRNLRNRYYAKTARNAVRKLRATTVKEEAAALYVKVSSMLDKLAKKNVIHKNKAANLKSKLKKLRFFSYCSFSSSFIFSSCLKKSVSSFPDII